MHLLRSAVTWLLLVSILPLEMQGQVGEIVKWGKDRAVKEAEDEVLRHVGEAAGLGSPILLNQNSAFRRVDNLRDFHPTRLRPATVADLNKPYPPGDYSLEVWGFCTRGQMHAPGTGVAYKLAPLEGRQAKAVSGLLVRGALSHVEPYSLQYAAWFIEAGTPLGQMRPDAQALIHRLIPEYEHGLEGDFLENLESTYNKYRLLPNMPPLDSLLAESEAGKFVLSVKRSREILADRTISAENLPDRLYEPQGDGLPRILAPAKSPQPSPWGEIQPGVFARLTVQNGFAAQNLFEFRITKDAIRTQKSSVYPKQQGAGAVGFFTFDAVAVPTAGLTLARLLALVEANPEIFVAAGEVAALAALGIIAYSVLTAAQPLTIVPVLGAAVSMASNVADTGVMEEVQKLVDAAKAAGTALTVCAALAQLLAAAKRAGDSKLVQKIKATEKAKGCRHSSFS